MNGKFSHEYQCPLFGSSSCNCEILWKFVTFEALQIFELYCNGRHTPESHRRHAGKFLAPLQKEAVMNAVQCDPNTTASKVIRNMSKAPDAAVRIDHKHIESVERLVRNKRDALLSKELGGVDLSSRSEGDEVKIKKIVNDNRFDDAVKAHNMNSRLRHFDPHQLLFTSFQFDEIVHYGMTTGHNIMNVARAINAGSLMFCTDGTFKVCRQVICVLGIRVGMLEGETATVGFSINPTESSEAIRATFNGFEAAFHMLFQVLKGCGHTGCLFCSNLADIVAEDGMQNYMVSAEWRRKVWPKKKFMSDDGLGHKTFVREDHPEDMRLKCYQHVGGE